MGYNTTIFNEGQILTHTDMNNIIQGIDEKQKTLISGKNIKTINNCDILGEGNLTILGNNDFFTTIELVDVNDYTIEGFFRPIGTENTSNSYCRTDFIDIRNCKTLTVYTCAASTSVSPVVWYNNEKEYISGETATTTEFAEFIYDVPENACYAVFSTLKNKGAYVMALKSATLEEYINSIPKTNLLSVAYISPNGADSNDGSSKEFPIQTFKRAKEILSRDGELIFLDGEYENFNIDLSWFAKISTFGQNAKLIYPRAKLNTCTKLDGYNKIYYGDLNINISSLASDIWQHNYGDTATTIKSDERHPLQRNRQTRLLNTRIYSITKFDTASTSLDEYLNSMDSNDNFTYYLDVTNKKLYFTCPSSDFNINPIILPASTAILGSEKRCVNISGLTIMYGYIKTVNLTGCLNNLSVGYCSAPGCIQWDNTYNLTLNNCEVAAGTNDGINGHTAGDILCINCWGHDMADDGESDHETCHIVQYGGLYEYNGNGCTPASGASGEYYNTICRNNGDYTWVTDKAGTAFSAQGDGALIYCNGCVSINNIIGFRATGDRTTGTFINCISDKDKTSIEKTNSVFYNGNLSIQ